MPWVEFTSDYDERIRPRVIHHHPAGTRDLISEAAADDVEAKQAGFRIKDEETKAKARHSLKARTVQHHARKPAEQPPEQPSEPAPAEPEPEQKDEG
jgi:hypothetical protein